jgi:hypothetical protein
MKKTPWPLLLYAVQFFFGGWFLAHGLNHWLEFFPRPAGSSPLARELIGALNHTGLFAIVKGIEVLVGLLLLLNRWVPLAIMLACPVALSIAHLNLVANTDPTSVTVGILSLGLLGVLAWGYWDKFRSLLSVNNPATSRPVLRPALHLLAAIAGIAVPVGLTFWTTSAGGVRSAAHYQAVAQASRVPHEVVAEAEAAAGLPVATQIIAEGEWVAVLRDGPSQPQASSQPQAQSQADVYRVVSGKIVSHWTGSAVR